MTFYRTPQRQSFDANIFEESMIDYGEQVAVRDDLGAIGGMLGYGQIFHSTDSSELPNDNYMSGSDGQLVGITGTETAFPAVGVEPERQDDSGYWGLRIVDSGVWFVKVNFRCNPRTTSNTFRIAIRSNPKYSSLNQVILSSEFSGEFSDVIVADDPGELVVPTVRGSGRWDTGEMKMTMYRIDGGDSSFSQTNLRK